MTFNDVFDPADERHAEAFLHRTYEGQWPDWIQEEWKAVGYTSTSKDKDWALYMLTFHYIRSCFSDMYDRFNRRNDLFP